MAQAPQDALRQALISANGLTELGMVTQATDLDALSLAEAFNRAKVDPAVGQAISRLIVLDSLLEGTEKAGKLSTAQLVDLIKLTGA